MAEIEITFIFRLHRHGYVVPCKPFVTVETSSVGLVGCQNVSSVAQPGQVDRLSSNH